MSSNTVEIVTDIDKLRGVCREVNTLDHPETIAKALMKALETPVQGLRTMGLSGPQLGYQLRILVMKYGNNSICMVNPTITKQRGQETRVEMCLSLPGTKVKVPRPKIITVKGLNEYMRYVKYKLTDMDARVACHEIDHLDGKLIIDYAEKESRTVA